MTDALKLTTLTNSIAALGASISLVDAKGATVALKIEDIDEMKPEAIQQSKCPLMRPRVDNFVTVENGAFLSRDSYGADAALKSYRYTLNYVFYYCPVNQGNSPLSKYPAMVTALVTTFDYFAIHTNLSGAHELMPRLSNFGPVADGFDIQNELATMYHGGEIAFDVMQFAEAA